jgi:hypothetical protein
MQLDWVYSVRDCRITSWELLACTEILLIQDRDRPGAGFIRVSQQPMLDTAASVAAIAD